MSAQPETRAETPQQAARRLFASQLRQGYKSEALHEYRDAHGAELFWRARLRAPDGGKFIRPFHACGNDYRLGEPRFDKGKPLYNLPDLQADDPVFVVEGEGCADVLAKLGVVAVTSGSSSSAGSADWSPLKGRDVVVWPDADEPGAKYAADVLDKLREAGAARVRIIDVRPLGLAEHDDCVDWLKLHPDATAADVLKLATVEPMGGSPASDWGAEPEPLRRPLPEADEYPFDALGDVLAPAARSLAETVQAPDAIIGGSLLVAASLVAMAHADVHIDGRRVPLSIWAVSIAESGDRKSAVDELALRRHRSAERAEAQVYEMRRREFDIETQAHEAIARAARTAKKGRTQEDIKAALGGLHQPDAPLLPWLMAAEPTVEGLHRLLAEGRGYGGLMSDDGGDMLGGHSMSADHRMRTAAALSHLWDRGEYDRVRGGDGANKYYGRRLALHLMVQPVVAESILSDPMLTGQGFLARCLLAWPASLAGRRPYVQRDLSADPAMVRYWQRMGDLLDRSPPLAEGQRNELAPRPLRLTADAKALWVQIHDGIEAKMAPNNALASVKAWAAKGAEQILRVAGVLTLVHDPSADTIDADTIRRAGDVVAWHLGEAARIVGTASVPTEIRQAEAVLQWARESNIQLVHSRHLLRFGPSCVRTSDALRSAMAVLVRHGYASELPPGTVIDGKPRRSAWEII